MQHKLQVEMIGKVFYSLLASVGHQAKDEKMIKLSASLKEMLETRSYDNLMGTKVPHFKADILNLLKVVDMSDGDRAELMRLGFSELLNVPTLKKCDDEKKSGPSLEIEKVDKL